MLFHFPVLYVEDEPRRSYRVEDFLWTGSGDGDPDDPSWRTTTIYRTTTTTIVLATAYISPSPPIITTISLPHPVQPTVTTTCTVADGNDGLKCHTIKPTPTINDISPTSILPPWPPPPPQPPPLLPDQRFWLMTVLKANLSSEQLATVTRNFEPKLAHLYKTAFQRYQL